MSCKALAQEREFSSVLGPAFGFGYIALIWIGVLDLLPGVGRELGLYNEAALVASALMMLTGAVAMTLLHELGHASAALLCGWRVVAITAGPVTYRAEPFALTVRAPLGDMFTGATHTAPPTNRDTTIGWIAMTSGGIAANALFAAAIFYWLSEGGGSSAMMSFAGSLALLSLWLAVSNTVPFTTANGVRSDGGMILDAIWGKAASPRAALA